jgi:hypothetical protein
VKSTPEHKVIYPNLLRQKRKYLHMSVQEMARTIGVSEAAIYRWESGTGYCRPRAIRHRVFKAYGTTPVEAYPTCWEVLFGDTGEDLLEGK